MPSEMVQWRVPKRLRSSVTSVVGYRQVGEQPGLHRGLPSAYLTMIVALDDPLDMAAHPTSAQRPGTFDVLVGGLHDRPALIRHRGHQHGLHISLTPEGARTLLGMPAGQLGMIDVHGSQIWGPSAGELHERLSTASTWAVRFRALETWLDHRTRETAPWRPEIRRAVALIECSRGQVEVSDLARDVGYSPRRLGQLFADEVGLSPKGLARVVRFDHSKRLLGARLQNGGPADLGELARACGYYDQSHLARDWRTLSGVAPSRWVTEEFRFVQVRDGSDGTVLVT